VSLKKSLIVLSLLSFFIATGCDASAFTVRNDTDLKLTVARVADPLVRSLNQPIEPGANAVIALRENTKFTIKIDAVNGGSESIVYMQRSLPLRCLSGDFICSHLSVSGVTIRQRSRIMNSRF
jgi:hypothetical protein